MCFLKKHWYLSFLLLNIETTVIYLISLSNLETQVPMLFEILDAGVCNSVIV